MKTKNNTSKYLSLALGITLSVTACTRDGNPTPDIPPADGTEITLNGGIGAGNAQNIVFVDLSDARQDSAKRTSWDIGFYNGDQYRVILNSSNGAVTAKSTGETDINAVSSANIDVEELALGLDFATLQPIGSFDLVDDTAGTLNNTAIAAIESGDNPVYVVNTVGGTTVDAANVWKIKISQASDGYTVQFAQLDAANIQTVQITKDNEYNFKFLSFANGLVEVEPAKTAWDFSWGVTLYHTSFNGVAIPYNNSDFIKLNILNNVQAVQVLEAEIAYADFSESHLASITLSGHQNIIGNNWRKVTGSPLGAQHDRYYIIKDTGGNIYKLRFNAMGAQSGTTPPPDGGRRGYPELEYKLVKRG